MSLCSLPFELKLKVFRRLSDIPTLSALVHASPAFHAVYAAYREQLFTRFTMSELDKRAICILEPASFLEVNVKDDEVPSPHIKAGILALHKTTREQRIAQLSIEQCVALLTIRRLIPWSVEPTKFRDILGHGVCDGKHVSWLPEGPPETPSSIEYLPRFCGDNFLAIRKFWRDAENLFFIDLEMKEFPRMTPLYPKMLWKIRVLLERGENWKAGVINWGNIGSTGRT